MSRPRELLGMLARLILLSAPILLAVVVRFVPVPDAAKYATFTIGFLWFVGVCAHFWNRKRGVGTALRNSELPHASQCEEFDRDENTPPWMWRLP